MQLFENLPVNKMFAVPFTAPPLLPPCQKKKEQEIDVTCQSTFFFNVLLTVHFCQIFEKCFVLFSFICDSLHSVVATLVNFSCEQAGVQAAKCCVEIDRL